MRIEEEKSMRRNGEHEIIINLQTEGVKWNKSLNITK